MVPCPHMPRYPTLLKKITPAAQARIHGFTQQSADYDVRTPGLIHHGGTEIVVLGAESFQTGAERPASQVRAAADYQPCGFTAGMGIDDSNFSDTAAGHE